MKNKIGILIDNLRLGVRDGIVKAKELGADGFQVYCTQGELAPENMPQTKCDEFKQFVSDQGLEISALCGDLGRGFLNAEANLEIIPRMKEIIDLAERLNVYIVTSHIGRLPDDEESPLWTAGLHAFDELGAYAETRGCVLAMETGPEEPALLKKFLDKIQNQAVGVNYDPANLIMTGPFDHIGGVRVLKDYIVHTHAKDGVRLQSEKSGGGDFKKRKFLEVPLGHGSVAFRYYVWMLETIGYKGYLTIERETGLNRVADVAAAVRFLRQLEPWNGMVHNSQDNTETPIDLPSL